MKRLHPRKAAVPVRVLIRALLPFGVPIFLILAFLLIAGPGMPRDIAPGSGLKLAGLVATLVTTGVVMVVSVRGISERRVRGLARVLCLLVGLMAWPVWSVGVLPFVNAIALHGERTVLMTLERTEATSIKNSPEQHHWAWLTPNADGTGVSPGRHFIPKATFDLWAAEKPASVDVEVATGLLGATVVTDIRSP